MNYALVENGIVINVIVWDGNTETWSPPDEVNAVAIPDEQLSVYVIGSPVPATA
jgi:hypothetical protein